MSETVAVVKPSAVGIQLFTVIPLLGQLVYSCYTLVNYLWPVWDPRRQAVHDKIGRTLVVRTR